MLLIAPSLVSQFAERYESFRSFARGRRAFGSLSIAIGGPGRRALFAQACGCGRTGGGPRQASRGQGEVLGAEHRLPARDLLHHGLIERVDQVGSGGIGERALRPR